MTTWKYHLGLLVFLCLSSPSEADCIDYFELKKWVTNLTDVIPLIATDNLNDQMECAAESECLKKNEFMCHLFHHCFNRTEEVESEKCKGDKLETVYFYVYMCETAKVIGHTEPHCKYPSSSQGEPNVCLETTPVLSLTTAAMSATRPATASAPAETAATATTQITTVAIDGDKSNINASQEKEDLQQWRGWMPIAILSFIGNVALILWIYWSGSHNCKNGSSTFSERKPMMDSGGEEPNNELASDPEELNCFGSTRETEF
ncbi:uncharacterized protein LOC142892357 [Nelusetta ayraudi]|uniref:uncharacterized protein LOC142892357 n=1 Tax=Nelusetta ayraudi TaxID=303726 RepID=UPI003F6FDFE6